MFVSLDPQKFSGMGKAIIKCLGSSIQGNWQALMSLLKGAPHLPVSIASWNCCLLVEASDILVFMHIFLYHP